MFETRQMFKTSHIVAIAIIKKIEFIKDFNSSCFTLWLMIIEARDKIVHTRVNYKLKKSKILL